jgi:hypothetical protein
MSEHRIAIDYEDWIAWYAPEKNQIDPNASFNGFMFETYGPELQYVKGMPDNQIWTLIEEDGKMFLCPGYRFVNRFGYMICTIPFTFDSSNAEATNHYIKI